LKYNQEKSMGVRLRLGIVHGLPIALALFVFSQSNYHALAAPAVDEVRAEGRQGTGANITNEPAKDTMGGLVQSAAADQTCSDLDWYQQKCERAPVEEPKSPPLWRVSSILRSDGLEIPAGVTHKCRPIASLDDLTETHFIAYGPYNTNDCKSSKTKIDDSSRLITFDCSMDLNGARMTGTIELSESSRSYKTVLTENNGYTGTRLVVETKYMPCD
jgi:hypothetical protein